MISRDEMIAVIGMGYVGLPLAISLARKNKVVGFDIDKLRVENLKNGIDLTDEVSKQQIQNSKKLKFSSNLSELDNCKIYIVTVPTPVDDKNKPNLKPILKATKLISKVLSRNNLVIYESTVFPGVTEEICGPILEKYSGFKINTDLYLGYSPERINPGDKKKN